MSRPVEPQTRFAEDAVFRRSHDIERLRDWFTPAHSRAGGRPSKRGSLLTAHERPSTASSQQEMSRSSSPHTECGIG